LLASPQQICHQKEREITTNQERDLKEADLRKEKKKNRYMKKERKLKQTACSVFGCFMIKSQRIKNNLMF